MAILKIIGLGLSGVVIVVVLLTALIAIIAPEKEGAFAAHIDSDIVINAPPSIVWAILSDFKSYPSWNPFVRKIEGPMVVGDHLSIEIRPSPDATSMRFTPVVLAASPEIEFRWRGRFLAPGVFDGTHGFKLTSLPGGRTRFHQSEAFSGVMVPLFRGKNLSETEGGFNAMNTAIKARAEAMATAPVVEQRAAPRASGCGLAQP